MITLYLAPIDDDKEHFQKLYDTYNKKMFAMAKHILKSNALAEEAVQQAWLNIIKNFKTVRKIPLDSADGYVITTVKNISLNIYKKENRCEPLNEDSYESLTYPKNDNISEFEYIVDIVRKMPAKYREILELKFVLEWKNEEIAKFLGINASTVSTRIQRGRKLLIDRLNKEGILKD